MVARFPLCERRQLELAVASRLDDRQSHELAQHLADCPHCRAELEQLAGSSDWWQDARTFLSSSENAIGAMHEDPALVEEPALDFLEPADDPAMLGRLGAYNIEHIIGRGGMGVVLKAQDTALVRSVAIKVLATPLASSAAARKRFAREAQAAAAVVHDHVIPIHCVEIAGPVPFLVMPYITGRSLQERLDAHGPLETKEVLRITMQTARGLAAAHAQGLVHRDIKPANILLENGVERVRITDFGLARAIDDASQTQSGFIAGTPQYMAPEQARGESVDARADLFSLGSVMYAMCAGHPPFRAETTLAVLRRICDDQARPVREVNPDVPSWLAAIIHKLLAKAPAERFQAAEEVATLLERWLAHLQQPTVIAPPEVFIASPEAKRFTFNSRLAWLAGIGTAAALSVAVIATVAWQWRDASRATSDPWAQRASTLPSKTSGAPDQEYASEIKPQARNPESPASSLSPAAIDEELERVQQSTSALEEDWTVQGGAGFSFTQEIDELNLRLSLLEQELQLQSPPPVRYVPAEQTPSTSPTPP